MGQESPQESQKLISYVEQKASVTNNITPEIQTPVETEDCLFLDVVVPKKIFDYSKMKSNGTENRSNETKIGCKLFTSLPTQQTCNSNKT